MTVTISPTIAVFFDHPEFDSYPFEPSNLYRDAYEELGRVLQAKGARFAIVRDQKTYINNNRFAGHWLFERDAFQRSEDVLAPDLIYNKGHFAADAGARTLNVPELDRLCSDKTETYAAFAEFCPQSLLVRTVAQLQRAIDACAQQPLIVAKPPMGEEGKGIVIDTPQHIRTHHPPFPFIVQQYIDTSHGIPGLTDDRHDLRMVVMNGAIISAHMRTPKAGSFLANVAQGGSINDVPVTDIPAGALEILQNVERTLSRFPQRIYALDVCRDSAGRWWIIELNAKPGLPYRYEEGFAQILDRLADTLIAAAEMLTRR